ncbi:MAG: hypothetical protein Q8R38_06655 [Candidatus Omnitrophota bacterium]|nr:hypothetical protein [Candidatus Omnitrophota bacterium]
MKKKLIIVVLFIVGVAFGLVLAHGPLNAQGDSDILSKLNDIAKGQEDLMAAMNSIREDLQIIKVRVTQLQ